MTVFRHLRMSYLVIGDHWGSVQAVEVLHVCHYLMRLSKCQMAQSYKNSVKMSRYLVGIRNISLGISWVFLSMFVLMLCSKMHELFWSICILESLPKIMKGSLTFLYCGRDLSFIVFFFLLQKAMNVYIEILDKCQGHLIGPKWTLPPLHPFAGFEVIFVKWQWQYNSIIIMDTIFTFITSFWHRGKFLSSPWLNKSFAVVGFCPI